MIKLGGIAGVVGLALLASSVAFAVPAFAAPVADQQDLSVFMPAGMHLKQLGLTVEDLLKGVDAELGGYVGDRVAAKFVGANSDPILGKGASLVCRDLSATNGKSWWRHHRGFEGEVVHRRIVDGVQTWWIKGVRGGVAATELVFAPAPGVACSVTVYGRKQSSQLALRYAGRMVRSGRSATAHATGLTPVVRSDAVSTREGQDRSITHRWKKVDPDNPSSTPCASDWTDVNWVPAGVSYQPWAKWATVCANKQPHWGSTLIDWTYACPSHQAVMAFYVGWQYNDRVSYYAPLGAYATNWSGIHISQLEPFMNTQKFARGFMRKVRIRFWNPGTSGSDWTWPIFPCVQPNNGTFPR